MGAHMNYYMENSLMEKKAAAVDLIKVRLSEMPNDPRLWYVFVWLCIIDTNIYFSRILLQ